MFSLHINDVSLLWFIQGRKCGITKLWLFPKTYIRRLGNKGTFEDFIVKKLFWVGIINMYFLMIFCFSLFFKSPNLQHFVI